MRKTICQVIVFVILINASPCFLWAQDGRSASIRPPQWLIGCWANTGQSHSDYFETYDISDHDIVISHGFPGTKSSLAFKYQAYEVEQHITNDSYTICFSLCSTTYVYHFRVVRSIQVGDIKLQMPKQGIGLDITKNEEILRLGVQDMGTLLFECYAEKREHT